MTTEDVTGLKAKVKELLGEIRVLKDGKLKLERENALLSARIDGGGHVIEDNESPRDKFFREQSVRLAGLQKGSPEYQAEIDAILSEPAAVALMDAELEGDRAKREQHLAHLSKVVETATARQKVEQLATQLAKQGSAAILRPHLAERVRTEWRGDECIAVVVDANGKPSSDDALTLEFREMRPEFASVVQGASAEDKASHAKLVAEMLGQSVASTKKITRAQFDAMDADARTSAMSGGAQVVDH